MATNIEHGRSTARWAGGAIIVAGVWLIFAPFVLGYTGLPAAFWNDIVIGILVAALAAASGRTGAPTATAETVGWTLAGIGAWLIIAPFVLPYGIETEPVAEAGVAAAGNVGAATWNDIILGLIVLALGAWSAISSRQVHARPARTTTETTAARR